MFRAFLCLCIYLILPRFTVQESTNLSSTYIGGVVQYYPKIIRGDEDDSKIVTENVFNYMKIIESAAEVDIDILVFPEFGLTGIPDFEKKKTVKDYLYMGSESEEYYKHAQIILKYPTPQLRYHQNSTLALKYRKAFQNVASKFIDSVDKSSPCLSELPYTKFIRDISCYAQQYGIYIVINHYETENCTSEDCPDDGFFLYNANTVFDWEGRIIGHYRKYNMFDEPWAERENEPGIPTFSTDFGVIFGQLIGNDITIQVMPEFFKAHNIADVVFTTNLHNDVLFLSSIQDLSFWSHIHNINLLTSGFSVDGSSDICFGRNRVMYLKRYFYYENVNAIHYGEIKKKSMDESEINTTKVVDYERLFLAPSNVTVNKKKYDFVRNDNEFYEVIKAGEYNSMILEYEFSQEMEVCTYNLCCKFYIVMDREVPRSPSTLNHYSYRAIAFRGVYKLKGDILVASELCAIVSCTSRNIEDCGKKFPNDTEVSPVTFRTLSISRDIDSDHSSQMFSPIAAWESGSMFPGLDYELEITNSTTYVLDIRSFQHNILIFGINGRIFDVSAWFVKSPKLKNDHLSTIIILVTFLAVVSVLAAIVCIHSKYSSTLNNEEAVFHVMATYRRDTASSDREYRQANYMVTEAETAFVSIR